MAFEWRCRASPAPAPLKSRSYFFITSQLVELRVYVLLTQKKKKLMYQLWIEEF
ncbi:hypothetical protein RchiOBHm_Chr2g0175881 [Rosa chinensis]|uniref:Uncharacterized protein n=1 Tax=Rosa chinensis TaxID=74649 RepID=A0A2P6S6I7_ROSCH|nr:hypothetical protein RchiOBHm_Chr2g0175881 [Rosa chinensis]